MSPATSNQRQLRKPKGIICMNNYPSKGRGNGEAIIANTGTFDWLGCDHVNTP